MNFQKSSYWILILTLLVSTLSLTTPVQAQTVDPKTTLVIWCPSAVTPPTPHRNGCTNAYASLNDLWTALGAAEPARAGTIWLGKNFVNSTGNGNQTLDGLTWTHMKDFPLKIYGGWNGLGKSTLSATMPSTFDSTALTVQNWAGSVTIVNIRVKNAATTGCNVLAAVCVGTAGNIKLDRVQVSGSSLPGAYLDNTISVSSPHASVTVTNSMFLRNDGEGLWVKTNGAVMIKNVTSGQNIAEGVTLANDFDATASPVAVTNSLFVGNSSEGLEVSSNGTVTLTRIEAQHNQTIGTKVNNAFGTANVLLQGTNTFLGNDGDGLYVTTKGSVTARDIIAYDNGEYGVLIDNGDFATGKGVTISGSVMFKGNRYYGLSVSNTGPIIASNLTAMSNGVGGLYLRTSAPVNVQAVTLTNLKVNFSTDVGIYVFTDGKVTLSCGTVYGTATTGLLVRNYAGTGPAAALKLQGFRSYLNGTDEDLFGTPVVRTACP